MSIGVGTRLGSFEITALLGKGGMGEVYRARDTKLKRDVAIKILPDELSCHADRVSRFQREAEVLASLNHPNVAAIYDLEEANGLRFLVLELVEGQTLANRITRGPIVVEESLQIAKQICEALVAAHEKGIVHRDLKPANVKLTPAGKVKVLDFGLAKAFQDQQQTALSNSPTLTGASVPGMILGTAAYMSPEQVKGKEAGRTSDVWALGCVLYEMLTGRAAFERETLGEILAGVLKETPDWSRLSSETPDAIRRLLRRCLQKDPRQRFQDIGEVGFQIDEALSDPVGSTAAPRRYQSTREWTAWIAAALLLGTTLFFAARPSGNQAPSAPVSFQVFPPQNTVFSLDLNTTVNVPQFALSPDGRALVYSAGAAGGRPMLWLRSMEQVSARELAGTEGAQYPFWSADGSRIGFFAAGRLKNIPIAGGPAQIVAETAFDFRGGAWGPEDIILYANSYQPISLVNSAGGQPTPITTFDASRHEGSHRYPQFLADGHHFLYSILSGMKDQTGIYVGSLDGKVKKHLINVRTSAVYVPPGYILFVDGDTLMANGFDANRLELRGQPFAVAEHVGRNTASLAAVSASQTGAIAYAGAISWRGRLTWIDRGGKLLGGPDVVEGDYADFRLAPDEKRLAASLLDPKTGAVEIWLIDLARNSTLRFSSGGALTGAPLWSEDGGRLVFRSNRNGLLEIFQKSASGGGDDQTLFSAEASRAARLGSGSLALSDWSPDGHNLIFSVASPATGTDLWLLPSAKDAQPVPFIASSGEQMHGNFSPVGNLVAYTSNESGRFEVYVETFPRSDRKWPVSTNGGYEPRWRADGREIYYLSEDRKLMAVSVGAGPTFGIPKPLFQTRVPAGVAANHTHYVPSRDGQRFLVNTQTSDPSPSPITVVVNWTSALGKK